MSRFELCPLRPLRGARFRSLSFSCVMSLGISNDEYAVTDLLGRANFARTLGRAIASCETPLVIGLYGTWGSGKTSLMHQIASDLPKSNIAFVHFDPWKYQFDEEPAVALLHTMVDSLQLGDRARKLLMVIAGALGSILLKATTTLDIENIRELGEQYEQERFQLREKQARLQTCFRNLISIATDEGKKRLVFFIDDLDRCVPEAVLKVLEALKLYLNLPGCVYVIGVDRTALECSIKYRYKELEVREADYLDKIVQLPFTIPPIAEQAMERFLRALLPKELQDVANILVAGLTDNPRQIKRFVNSLILNHELARTQLEARYDPKILTGVLLIQYRQPELFKAAMLRPSVIIEAVSGTLKDALLLARFQADNRLSRALPHLKSLGYEELTRYIFLSEVASPRTVGFDLVLTRVPLESKPASCINSGVVARNSRYS